MDDPAIVAEQSLLGAVLMNNAAFDAVDGRVSTEDFKEPLHQRLWQVFAAARQNGQAVDYKLAIAALGSDAKVEILPDYTVGRYVAKLAAEATTVVGCRDYAALIRRSADFRRIADVAENIRQHVARPEVAPPAEVAKGCIEQLDAIVSANTTSSSKGRSIGQAAETVLDRMMEAKDRGRPVSGIPSGLTDIDRATLGMHKGEMILVGARPSVGKTSYGVSVALSAAHAGHGVAFFSLEMGAEALTERAIASMIHDGGRGPTYRQIRAGQVEEWQCERVAQAALDFRALPLWIDDTPGLTAGQIVSRTRRKKAQMEDDGHALDLVVIDHVHLVQASQRYAGNRTAEVTEISGAIKALAKDLDVAVLVLCQLNRGNENREDKRPQLSDLRDSGALEQDADVVIFLHRESYYLERQKGKDAAAEHERLDRLSACENTMDIAIAKQRQGPITIATVFCDIGRNAIRDLAR